MQGATGFGFALLAGPALVALLTPEEAVSALAVLGLVVNTVTLGADRRPPHILGGEARRLLAWALPGLPLGAVLLARLPADAVRIAVGVLVLGAVLHRLRGAGIIPPAPATGLVTGALTTATGLNGPPLAIRLAEVPPAERRDTLAALFLVLGVLGIGTLVAGGQFDPPAMTWVLAAGAVAGTFAGRRVADRLPPAIDRTAVSLVLAGAGIAAILSGLT